MTAPSQKIKTLAEYTYRPIMSAWFAWKKGGTATRYSYELRNTLKEIRYRGQLPHIDFDYGFQSLVSLIEEHHKGKYNFARIYGHVNENDKEGKLLREYTNDQLSDEFNSWPDFKSEKWQKHKDSLANKIYIKARHAKIVKSVLNEEILK